MVESIAKSSANYGDVKAQERHDPHLVREKAMERLIADSADMIDCEQNAPERLPKGEHLIEPVAWMYRWKDEPPVYMDSKRDWAVHNADWIETPLYTAAAINEAVQALDKQGHTIIAKSSLGGVK